MSILQLEISDETRQMLEAQANWEERDTQSWAVELVEEAVRQRQQKYEFEKVRVEQKLLEALESGPAQFVDDAWWERLEKEAMAELPKPETP